MDKEIVKDLYQKIKTQYPNPALIVKRKLVKAGLFDYFFKNRKKIYKWNKNKRLIRFSFFGLKLTTSPEFMEKLDSLYMKYVFPVIKYLHQIIQDGWRWQILTVREYNLIVYFYDFSDKLGRIEKEHVLSSKSFMIMEESFLRLAHYEKYPEMLINGLKKILLFYKRIYFKGKKNINELIANLRLFFSQQLMHPNIYDIIIAFNIVQYKRFLLLDDIKMPFFRDTVQTDFYNCPIEVFENIAIYTKNKAEELKKLQRKQKYIEWLQGLSLINKNDRPLKIISFYEKLGHNWLKDKNDAFLLFILLTEGIINNMKALLEEKWSLMTNQEKIIEVKIISAKDIDMYYEDIMNNFQKARSKHSSILQPQISLSHYRENDDPGMALYDKGQMYIYAKIENILYLLRCIADVFNRLYEKRINHSIPILNYMIVNPPEWKGKPVFDVFRYYMELFLQICGFFKEKKLQMEMKKYPHLLKEIEDCKNRIRWTIDTDNVILKELGLVSEGEEFV